MSQEAHSRERQAKWDEYQREGLNPNTPSRQKSSNEDQEEEDLNEVNSRAAYEEFFAPVNGSRSGAKVTVLDASEGSSSAAAGRRAAYPLPPSLGPPSSTMKGWRIRCHHGGDAH